MKSGVITPKLIKFIQSHYQLDWQGIHGVSHWARVRRNGLYLSCSTPANRTVVELFAFLHDIDRRDDGADAEHGFRASETVQRLQGRYFKLSPNELELLVVACRDHSEGYLTDEPTVAACWDADRLDLGRVGIGPEPSRLSTSEARKKTVIDRCFRQSTNHHSPSIHY